MHDSFLEASQEFETAQKVADTVRIPCWSLYLFQGPMNVELDMVDAFFQFMCAYPTQAEAEAAAGTTPVCRYVDPIWFIAEEELSASGTRRVDGRPVRRYKEDCTDILRRGIFKLWSQDKWTPYFEAVCTHDAELHVYFKDILPFWWDTTKLSEWGIEGVYLAAPKKGQKVNVK